MPSKKAVEQAMIWLRSIAADKDSLDGINAQVCLNVINGLQFDIAVKGNTIYKLRTRLNDLLEKKLQDRKNGKLPLLELLSREEHSSL